MNNAIVRNAVVDRQVATDLVNSVRWFHRVEVLPGLIAEGIVPPTGSYNAAGYIDSLNLGDLSAKRILELGTWDGPLAFELAQRGADVVASDIQDPSKTGFNVLRAISGIDIPYVRCSVYELSRHFTDEFDVVLFFGVFYHLKHPFLAFEEVARCIKPGGLLFTEGEGLGSHIEDLRGNPVDVSQAVLDQLEQLAASGVPLTLSYPGTYIDGENWVIPNEPALEGWLVNAGLETDPIYKQYNGRSTRIGCRATKIEKTARIEHSLTGEAGGYASTIAP